MSLSHNTEADFASSELARMFMEDSSLCYAGPAPFPAVSANATYEPSASAWPKADGVISLLVAGAKKSHDLAVEYKREQEGPHGLLTAIGQALGYIDKGYHGAAIVVPASYSSHDDPAGYVAGVLARSSAHQIGVFKYNRPDTSGTRPFKGRLTCVRQLCIDKVEPRESALKQAPGTQWVHMREGSTTRDAFYRFLQEAKKLSAGAADPVPAIPAALLAAAKRSAPSTRPELFLSSTSDDKLLSRVWRSFFFGHAATLAVLTPWKKEGKTYLPPGAYSLLERDDRKGNSQFFEGRANGLKEKICEALNDGDIDEATAWQQFADGVPIPGKQKKQGIAARAHSFREDLDSALQGLKLIDAEGRPTEEGYRYAGICERYGSAHSPAAIEYHAATLLKAGHYAALLHYVHRLSEERFSADPLAFTERRGGRPVFTETSYSEYLEFLQDKLHGELKVLRRVGKRDTDRKRTVFQAELTLLRNYGFISKRKHRLGVGLPIDWERVVAILNVGL